MKEIALLLILSSLTLSQERFPLKYFGEIGFGVSNSNSPQLGSTLNNNLAITAGYNDWYARVTNKLNGLITISFPKIRTSSTSVMFGKSTPIYREYSAINEVSLEWNVLAFIGISRLSNVEKTEPTINGNSFIHTKTNQGFGIPIEIELQYLLPKSHGAALNLFYTVNSVKIFYGFSISILFGSF
jgi:hypothetical protein